MGVVVRATVATGVVGEVFHVLHRPRVFNVPRGVVLLRGCGCTRRARSSNGRCRRRNGTFHVRHSRARRSWIQRGVDAATNVAAAHSRRSGRARCAAGNLASRLQTCASLFAFGSPACPIPPVRTTPRLASTVNTVRRRARVILLIRGGGSGSPFTVGALAVATGDRALPSAAVWLPGHDAAQQIVRLFDGCRAAPLCRH
jgi:hypothetical protein